MHAHVRMWTLFTAYEMLNNMNKIKSSVETQKIFTYINIQNIYNIFMFVNVCQTWCT